MIRIGCAVAVSVALVALGGGAPSAHADDFADPGARMFTLVPDGAVTAVAALPGGDVVYAERGRLMLLTADGRVLRVRADGAYALAAESARSVVRVPQPRTGRPDVHSLERVDVLTGRVTRLPRLPGDWNVGESMSAIDAVAVLDDRTVVAATVNGMYAITSDGRASRLPHHALGGQRGSLAALPGRRFAFSDDGDLVVGDLSGRERRLARGLFAGPVTGSGDGGVLATLDESTGESLVRVGGDGALTRLLTPPARSFTTLGNGDGLPLLRDELPPGGRSYDTGALALTDDGTLVFRDRSGHGLRALVPPGSTRPRVALTQDAFTTFAAGRIRFAAAVPGTVAVVASRRGSVISGHTDVAGAGEGEIALNPMPAPGRYTVKVFLTLPSGARTEAVAHLDTRPVLPLRDARARLRRSYADSDGDDGGELGTELGDCRREAPRTIRCLLLKFEFITPFDGPRVGQWWHVTRPVAWVVADLFNDGVHAFVERSLPNHDASPRACLRVSVDHVQHLRGLASRVQARCAAQVRVSAHLRWRGSTGARTADVRRVRNLRARQSWHAALRVPRRAERAAEAGHPVHGEIVVRATTPTRYGTIPEEHGYPVILRR